MGVVVRSIDTFKPPTSVDDVTVPTVSWNGLPIPMPKPALPEAKVMGLPIVARPLPAMSAPDATVTERGCVSVPSTMRSPVLTVRSPVKVLVPLSVSLPRPRFSTLSTPPEPPSVIEPVMEL